MEDEGKFWGLVLQMGFKIEDAKRWNEDIAMVFEKHTFIHDSLETLIRKYEDNPRELAMVIHGYTAILAQRSLHKALQQLKKEAEIKSIIRQIIKDTGADPEDVVLIKVTSEQNDSSSEKNL